jgi:predicted RNA binding protein YcfA (HicA-like mRNA interferase family)
MGKEQKIVSIHHQKLVKIFEIEGFTVSRQKGEYLILTKPGVIRPVVIKTSPYKVAVTHIMTNLRTAGISRERYFELLDKI